MRKIKRKRESVASLLQTETNKTNWLTPKGKQINSSKIPQKINFFYKKVMLIKVARFIKRCITHIKKFNIPFQI